MTYLLVYLAGFILVGAIIGIAVRHEPTTHGRGVLAQIGCVLTVIWPIALLWFAVVGVWLGWRKLTGQKVFPE